MRIQLWSYNYDPEPTGIAPLSTVWIREMVARGHQLEVIAAHPHYPEPAWGPCLRPYRERRDGVAVLRLPLWYGRASSAQRLRQELSHAAVLGLMAPTLSTPDVKVVVSPSFPALLPAMVNARARGVPWALWLQDVLPDGAVATGLLDEGPILRAARRFERVAYRSASEVVVISQSFRDNLIAKGVSRSKLARIYNPASRALLATPRPAQQIDPATVLTMGNIGHTQNLVAVSNAFQRSEELTRFGARLVIAGDGVAVGEVRRSIATERVHLPGLLGEAELERALQRATVALVSQRYEGVDFNVPSKLMNFMGYGIPVVASVRRDSEVARIVERSGGGWVTDCGDLTELTTTLARVLEAPDERARRGAAALRFAREHFAPSRTAEQFEAVLGRLTGGS